jgi:hypothetical protein
MVNTFYFLFCVKRPLMFAMNVLSWRQIEGQSKQIVLRGDDGRKFITGVFKERTYYRFCFFELWPWREV